MSGHGGTKFFDILNGLPQFLFYIFILCSFGGSKKCYTDCVEIFNWFRRCVLSPLAGHAVLKFSMFLKLFASVKCIILIILHVVFLKCVLIFFPPIFFSSD